MDTQNYMEVTSVQYGEMLQFPLSTLYLSWRYRTIQRMLMRGASPDTTLEQLGIEVVQSESNDVMLTSCNHAQLLARAEDCINHLSSRLGEGPYFNGER